MTSPNARRRLNIIRAVGLSGLSYISHDPFPYAHAFNHMTPSRHGATLITSYLAGNMKHSKIKARPSQGGTRITASYLHLLGDRECLWRFRMTAHELIDTANTIQIPASISTRGRYRFSGLEAFALTLARFRTPGDIGHLALLYNRSESSISEAVNFIVGHVDRQWAHLLHFDTNGLLSQHNLTRYADAVYRAGAPLRGVWGFIDCTIRRVCRPHLFQNAAYNGYKKYHALKYQAVMLPCGLIGHLHGPIEGSRNDNFLLDDSALMDRCAHHAFREGTDDSAPLEEHCLQLFGDPAYGLNRHLISPYSGFGEDDADSRQWNALMSKVRIEVEHGFGLVVNNWPLLNASWKLKIFHSPVGTYYRFGVFMTNVLTCLHSNQVASALDCKPPTLYEYLHN